MLLARLVERLWGGIRLDLFLLVAHLTHAHAVGHLREHTYTAERSIVSALYSWTDREATSTHLQQVTVVDVSMAAVAW